MREFDGVNELHKANTDYNRDVVNAIQLAKQAATERNLIDLLNGSKVLADIEREPEQKIVIKEEDIEQISKIIIREEDLEEER